MSSATDIADRVQAQRAFFLTGQTLSRDFRVQALEKLETAIRRREEDILAALKSDLGKSRCEAYMTEIGMVLSEIGYMRGHLTRLMRRKRVRTPLSLFPARSVIYREPYGVALIMAPWNYPFQLCLLPLVGALAAGNCAMLKPSNNSPCTSRIIAELIADSFPAQYVSVVQGGRAENTALLQERFDYIFFTGGVTVGKLVMESAARHVTPVSLELGGKSPCIVDATANIDLAGKRIAFGKWLNSGQTCVAPDYVLADESVYDALLSAIKRHTESFYGADPMQCEYYPHIVNDRHYTRLMSLIQGEHMVMGGQGDGKRISPTVLRDVRPDAPVMQEEIFGPVLPVLRVKNLDEAIDMIRSREKPLALYLFTQSEAVKARVLGSISFGGGCVNDTILHLATDHMPFGGVGQSGMGSYHGRKSFETFSHEKSVLHQALKPDIALRYPPYTERKLRIIRRLM